MLQTKTETRFIRKGQKDTVRPDYQGWMRCDKSRAAKVGSMSLFGKQINLNQNTQINIFSIQTVPTVLAGSQYIISIQVNAIYNYIRGPWIRKLC